MYVHIEWPVCLILPLLLRAISNSSSSFILCMDMVIVFDIIYVKVTMHGRTTLCVNKTGVRDKCHTLHTHINILNLNAKLHMVPFIKFKERG